MTSRKIAHGRNRREREKGSIEVKRKGSSSSVVPYNNSRPVPRHEEEENIYAGFSTDLVLYEDQCKIKKKLTKSDLSAHLSRLMLPRGSVEAHVFRLMDNEMKKQVESKDGMKVVVRNADTRREHKLVFRRWGSPGTYVLNGGWHKLFVKERELEVGHEIGMFWDKYERKFFITVHRRVARGPSNAAA
ncbi:hypothetical protein EUGRSUZ_E01948 [Eucalyptus grandis]|uniref:TF-B3 domain-containing protein n=2 Tax=Eucalyptus grandis TaxID=71139 RepID=A0A059C550_EUCGR|nr:hypothetical protein EUGRSUZ_E01948 [Eucalyptus grandis]